MIHLGFEVLSHRVVGVLLHLVVGDDVLGVSASRRPHLIPLHFNENCLVLLSLAGHGAFVDPLGLTPFLQTPPSSPRAAAIPGDPSRVRP